MKITLDLDRLRSAGEIDDAEYAKLKRLATRSTSSLAFNLLIGFSVVAVSVAALALSPTTTTAVVLGLVVLLGGVILLRVQLTGWNLLASVCVLVGALLASGGIAVAGEGSPKSLLLVTVMLAVSSFVGRSALLSVLATFALSACLGASTWYTHATYFLAVEQPALTVLVFSILAVTLYYCGRRLKPEIARLVHAASRASVFLVNFGFWIGSLWGDRSDFLGNVPAAWFSWLWTLVLLAGGIWAWRENRRWVLNTVSVFAGIHFYTHWFESFGASAATMLGAGLLGLVLAVSLKAVNKRLADNLGENSWSDSEADDDLELS